MTDNREPDVDLLHRVAGAIQNGLYNHGGIDPGTAACYSAASAALKALAAGSVTDNREVRMDQRGPIFESLPSGLDIMHWFLDKKMAREWVGCGGDADYILWHDLEAGSGSHVDLLAHVDHDASWYWLLDVGTYHDHGDATYDLLFVASDLDGKRRCEWRNEPTTKQPWHRDGLVWFADQIESFEGREAW